MSWEYDPKDWFSPSKAPPLDPPEAPPKLPTEEQVKQAQEMIQDDLMIASALRSMRSIVGDVDEVLKSRTLFGFTFDTDDVETLRLALAFMMVYKDME